MTNFPNRVQRAISEGYDYKLGQYISDGFSLFGKNGGMFVGYILVYFAIALGLSLVPVIGQIVSSLISPALLAGFYIVAHKSYRSEYTEFSNFFDGFSQWVKLFMASLVIGFFTLLIFSPVFIFFYTRFGTTEIDFSQEGLFDIDGIQTLIFLFVLFLAIVLHCIYMYTPLFILFDGLEFWDAMEASRQLVTSNLLKHIVFILIWVVIFFMSALPLLLGLLITIPAYYCSIYAAWVDITGYDKTGKEDDDILRHLIE
jgi:hypothetical protein